MAHEMTLETRASGGDAAAQLALARQLESAGQNQPARGWYARAAQRGNPAALRGLAANLLSQTPFEIENGLRFMRAAAEQGDAEALHVCAALAAQDTGLADNWQAAFQFLTASAQQGSDLARQELALLSGADGGVDFARWLAIPPARAISDSPRLSVIENFAAPEICDWLMDRARGRIERAKVYDPATGLATVENHRTNGSANFDVVHWDLPLVMLRTRIAQAAGLPTWCLEHPMVLHYEPGQEFEPHFDFLDPELPGLRREIAAKGQRAATFLVYLNDDYEGAETEFVELGIRHRGRKGDALLFWNLDPGGAPDRRTRHAGRAPASGQKWLLSQWIREEKTPQGGRLAVHAG